MTSNAMTHAAQYRLVGYFGYHVNDLRNFGVRLQDPKAEFERLIDEIVRESL